MEMSDGLAAVVRPRSVPDRILMAHRSPEDRHRLYARLRELHQGVRWKLEPHGVTAPPLDAACLGEPSPDLCVEFTPETARMLQNRTRARATHDHLKSVVRAI